mmetsp:Transcript_76126/g.150945  ORF Transcript_76126/g.150945 Transcript_76126/m.150945 type:complete len:200 (-) Transcript_76126:1101-1700(-)
MRRWLLQCLAFGVSGFGPLAMPHRELQFGRLFNLLNRSSSSSSNQAQSIASCIDTDKKCASWAADGECEKNKVFMEGSCAKSCGLCGAMVKVPRRRHVCEDEAGYFCPDRADRGECDSNKGDMLFRCPASCRVCPYASLLQEALGCDDMNDNCQKWASGGECEANPNCIQPGRGSNIARPRSPFSPRLALLPTLAFEFV